MVLLLPLIWLVSKKMGQNKTAREINEEREREEREECKREREEGRAIDTQPKAEESPTSPLDRNAPTAKVDV